MDNPKEVRRLIELAEIELDDYFELLDLYYYDSDENPVENTRKEYY